MRVLKEGKACGYRKAEDFNIEIIEGLLTPLNKEGLPIKEDEWDHRIALTNIQLLQEFEILSSFFEISTTS